MATWSITIGVILGIISFVIIVYNYFKNRRYYLIFYTLGINLYLFSVFYGWDIYQESKGIVFFILIFSSSFIFFISRLLSKQVNKRKNFFNKKTLIFLVVLSILIVFVGVYPSANYSVIFFDEVNVNTMYDKVIVGEVLINNTFYLPRRVKIDKFYGCVGNNLINIFYGETYRYSNYNYLEVEGNVINKKVSLWTNFYMGKVNNTVELIIVKSNSKYPNCVDINKENIVKKIKVNINKLLN